MNVFFSYSFPFLLHHSIAGSKLLSRFNNHDDDVNVVCHFGSIFYFDGGVGTSCRNNHDSDEEIEVDNTDQGEEEGITHLCGSMSQGLGEVKGVEPQNLHVTIVIQNT